MPNNSTNSDQNHLFDYDGDKVVVACNDDDDDVDVHNGQHHFSRNHEFLLKKSKSKSSNNIDDQYHNHGQQKYFHNNDLYRDRPHTSTGTTLKNAHENWKNVKNQTIVIFENSEDRESVENSLDDLTSSLYQLQTTFKTMRNSLTKLSVSNHPVSMNTSPKMVTSSLQEINGNHSDANDKQLPSSGYNLNDSNIKLFSKPIRVIKPTAIHPSVMDNYDPPRPSTSVGVHTTTESALVTQNHSSAFHQVHSSSSSSTSSVFNNDLKQCRSNSLSETSSLLSHNRNNPYSNPISMENIEQEKEQQSIWASSSLPVVDDEPIHMTLEEVRRIAFGSPERLKPNNENPNNNSNDATTSSCKLSTCNNGLQNAKSKIKNLFDNLLNKTPCIGTGCSNDYGGGGENSAQTKAVSNIWNNENQDYSYQTNENHRQPQLKNRNNRQRRRKHRHSDNNDNDNNNNRDQNLECNQSSPFIRRALPPVPPSPPISTDHNNNVEAINLSMDSNNNDNDNNNCNGNGNNRRYQSLQSVSRTLFKTMSNYERQKYLNYVSSIERVKNCGWYWGPISGEMAEKLLDPEPCGSFLVRDSSDEHYIFSLSFKLDGMVRHVRIEQEQGNFSFGSLKKFRSSTIVDFIESAMEHSRSGQFLFFLRLGPESGPIRVQLLHPVSRLKRVQSLQHICRFNILQYVRRDQIHELPLPLYLRYYLDTPYYYSEELAQMQREKEDQLMEERFLERRRLLQTPTCSKLLSSNNEQKEGEKTIISTEQPDEITENQPESKENSNNNADDDQNEDDLL